MSAQPSQVGAVDMLNALIATLRAQQRNVLCHPDRVADLEAVIEAEGMTGRVIVTPSNFMKPDEIYVYQPVRLP